MSDFNVRVSVELDTTEQQVKEFGNKEVSNNG